MSLTTKLAAGSKFPVFSMTTIGGETIDLASMPGWRIIVIYRGKHCPLCKAYFKTLQNLQEELAAEGVMAIAASADPHDKAEADVASEGWRFPVAYDLSLDQMRSLGLYISEPRSPEETDRPFAEPGLFVINPDGNVDIVDISNAPFARPDLAGILNGIRFIKQRGYLVRGTLE